MTEGARHAEDFSNLLPSIYSSRIHSKEWTKHQCFWCVRSLGFCNGPGTMYLHHLWCFWIWEQGWALHHFGKYCVLWVCIVLPATACHEASSWQFWCATAYGHLGKSVQVKAPPGKVLTAQNMPMHLQEPFTAETALQSSRDPKILKEIAYCSYDGHVWSFLGPTRLWWHWSILHPAVRRRAKKHWPASHPNAPKALAYLTWGGACVMQHVVLPEDMGPLRLASHLAMYSRFCMLLDRENPWAPNTRESAWKSSGTMLAPFRTLLTCKVWVWEIGA